MTFREAEAAIARAELEKARLRAAHLRWAASAASAGSPEPVLRQALYEAAAAELDVEIAEARLALAEAAPV